MNENKIYVIVAFSLDEKGRPQEMHNHGWYLKKEDALEFIEHAGTEAPGGARYEEPFEYRWTHVMIEEVSEGPFGNTEIIASYKAEWYKEPEYEADPKATQIVNKLRETRVKAVKLEGPAFDTAGTCNFSGI